MVLFVVEKRLDGVTHGTLRLRVGRLAQAQLVGSVYSLRPTSPSWLRPACGNLRYRATCGSGSFCNSDCLCVCSLQSDERKHQHAWSAMLPPPACAKCVQNKIRPVRA